MIVGRHDHPEGCAMHIGRRFSWTCLAVPLLLLSSPVTAAPDEAPRLTAEDRQLFDGMFRRFLFDPRGAERVRVKAMRRSVWGQTAEIERQGWLVEKPGEAARVYFADGESVAAPEKKDIVKVDYVAWCTNRYSGKKEEPVLPDDQRTRFLRAKALAGGGGDDTDLVLAAWLYRLGSNDLAARALAESRRQHRDEKADRDGLQATRDGLAWWAYSGLVHAYMVRADEEAQGHGERLLRFYADEMVEDYPQATAIMKDLERRKKKGTFNKPAPVDLPGDFAEWDVKKRVAFWINRLDEVDARQLSQPGNVELAVDSRVEALVALGDAAVPDLIGVIETDERLTRSVAFLRDFHRGRTVLGVREAALAATLAILKVRAVAPRLTGDDFTPSRAEGAARIAEELRAYWKIYGRLPFEERMMKVLTNPKASSAAALEAAVNLARFGLKRTASATIFDDGGERRPQGDNPVVARFQDPTVAEAILAAMDRELKNHDARLPTEMHDLTRDTIEDGWLYPLLELGDRRIAPVLARRCKESTKVRMRRKWAFAAHRLGEKEPLQQFAADVREAKITLPANNRPGARDGEQPGYVELRGIIDNLSRARTAENDRALLALAEKKHPYHDLVARRLLHESPDWHDGDAWFRQPYCLVLLRQMLDDPAPTGVTFKIEGQALKREEHGKSTSAALPESLTDAAGHKSEAAERVCDRAAEKLDKLMIGQVACHPLLKDQDARLKAMRESIDRFHGHYRRATREEALVVGASPFSPVYIPDLSDLDRGARAEDVQAGRAIFSLGGNGRKLSLALPASAILRSEEKKDQPAGVLILQAEAGSGGEAVYGVIGKDGVRTVLESEVTKVTPLGKK
jgi:hypothetical protein